MQSLVYLKESGNLWFDFIRVSCEQGLEHRKVMLRHLKHNLIEEHIEGSAFRVLCLVKDGGIQAFCDHVVAVQDLCWQDDQQLVYFLLVGKPHVFKLENF